MIVRSCRGGVSPPASAECGMQNAELDKFVGADSISARFFEFLLIYGGVDFIFVGTDVLGGP